MSRRYYELLTTLFFPLEKAGPLQNPDPSDGLSARVLTPFFFYLLDAIPYKAVQQREQSLLESLGKPLQFADESASAT